mgnify:CR=1 FL=1
MARAPDPRIEQAKAMYLKGAKLVEIASQLSLPEGTVRSWKNRYKWDGATLQKKKCNVAKKKGGQPGNKNAKGGPPGNKKAEKHGLFSKYLPKESMDIIDSMSAKSPLDLIWDAIQIQYAAIIRSQQIMYVKDRDDKTIEKIEEKDGNVIGEKWEVQQAWDKQASFLKAQSKAVDSLKNMVKDYLELEGQSKADADASSKDWKAAIIAIAKRRAEKDG